jgi:hypothetical protein
MDFIVRQPLDEEGERGPVDGWYEQTKDWGDRCPDQPPLTTCTYCGAHVADPHDPDCRISGDEAGDV